MLQKVYHAFARSFVIIVLITASQLLPNSVNAQSRVIDYWSFNSFANNDTIGQYADTVGDGVNCRFILNNRIRPVSADYSIINTATAQLWYQKSAFTSSSWPHPSYSICFTFLDGGASAVGTLNAQFGTPQGNYLRPRNPSDSMELRFYIPSTGYQNIAFSYASQSSSAGSGPAYEIYDYSIDSGVTWTKTGLSKTVFATNIAWVADTILITDPLAINNPKLVFRIHDSIHNNINSGNVRFDNIWVKGDTVTTTPQTLIYFWDFNSLSLPYVWGPYTWVTPPASSPFPYINPDYARPGFISANAKVHMDYWPSLADSGSGVWAASTYFDNVAQVVSDYDTVNSNWTAYTALAGVSTFSVNPVPAVNGIRPRNPLDSTYLYYYIPTTNYKNILLKYASQTSSLTSGDSIQTFNYSVDGGATWRLSGISEAYDSAFIAGMPTGTIPYRTTPITVQFTDPAANNCPGLVFRIGFKGRTGNTTGASGNNRFDNISVQGDSIESWNPTITTTPVAFGPYCSSITNTISIAYTTTGSTTAGLTSGNYLVQITNSAGVFPANFTSNIIGSGTTSPVTAIIPSGTTPGTKYRVRVINPDPGVYGTDNGTDISITSALNPNTGTPLVCTGLTTTLSNVTGGGTWSTSTSSIATVGSVSGTVTGSATGNAIIVYTSPTGCSATSTVTVNQVPTAILTPNAVCVNATAQLSDGITIGTWTSSNTSIATIGSSNGLVSGVTSGTVTITYGTPGCSVTSTLTINPIPSPIAGAGGNICVNSSVTLSDATGSGTWSSSSTSLAIVGSVSGIVTGVATGTPNITYILAATGCYVTAPVTVIPIPAPISGGPGCVGTTTLFTDATAFGAWSSSNLSAATVGSSTGVVTGVALGTSTIAYTLSTGCFVTYTVSINSLPSLISGTPVMCVGATTLLSNTISGGTWSSSNFALASVDPSLGIVSGIAAGNPVITYTLPTGCFSTVTVTVNPLPATITGQTSVYCIGSTANLSDATGGGTWSSSTTTIATVGSASGIVTGVAAGTATITYKLPSGCLTTLVENISSTPASISGPATGCVGTNASYTDVTAFGAWSSSNAAIATVGSGTGIVTGTGAGIAVITYSLSSFCLTTTTVSINTPPQAITGNTQVCAGLNTSLADTGSGSWTSSIPALATVNFSTGLVSGIVAGSPVITYMAPSGCFTTTTVTVNPLPAPIGGQTSVYCIGFTATLSDASGGGTWSSGNTSVAVVGSSSGIVTGVAAGAATITYTLPTGCINTLVENVSSTPAPITGAPTTCVTNSISYTDATAFGAWASSNSSIAAIGSGTGIVTGIATGSAVITYELSSVCFITSTVTVNPLPNIISGNTQVCVNSTTTLSDAGGGTWSSNIPALASVGLNSGIVTGIVAGGVIITYTLPTGCNATTPVTINPLPSISGSTNICIGLPSTLTGSITGGTWTSSNTSVATIDLNTGVISAAALGSTFVTYTLPTGCIATANIAVNPPPSPITGLNNICAGATTTYTDAGGGGWYSSNNSVATIGFGTGFFRGITAGVTVITYSLGTSCIATTTVTVNPLPAAITGVTSICPGLTTGLTDATSGGAWSSSNTSLATVGTGTGVVTGVSAGGPVITYTLGTGCTAVVGVVVNSVSPITGVTQVCAGSTTTLSNAISGGTWSSSNTALATTGASTGVVTGVTAGTPLITYTLASGCITSASLTVNAAPSAIAGNINVCIGATTIFSDATPGGTWSSNNTTIAIIGSGTGVVTSVSVGATSINYTLSTGCIAASFVSVNPLPSMITGANNVCFGLSTTLSDSLSGGLWSSGSSTIAIVASTGVVTGNAAGAAVITYTLPTTCMITSTMTVNPLPSPIAGANIMCQGATTTLSDISAGGTWNSSNTAITIGSTSGVVTGVSAGTSVITYKIATGCLVTTTITINAAPNINTMTGGGHYCVGDTGVHVGLGGSDAGTNYQLYRGTTTLGSLVPGIGLPLDFGLETVPGNYTVVASFPTTSCTSNMVGTAVVTVDSSYSPLVIIAAHPSASILSGQPDTLTAIVTNGGPAVTYKWYKNGTLITGATSSVYISNTFSNHDSVTCIVTSHSACGNNTSSNSLIISVINVGVKQVPSLGSDIRLFPNPNMGLFTVMGSLGTTYDQEVTLTITDMLGKVIYKNNVIALNGNINEQLVLNSSLANGMYLLEVHSESENAVFHFVIGK